MGVGKIRTMGQEIAAMTIICLGDGWAPSLKGWNGRASLKGPAVFEGGSHGQTFGIVLSLAMRLVGGAVTPMQPGNRLLRWLSEWLPDQRQIQR